MELTKEQRHSVYDLALDLIYGKEQSYMCCAIDQAARELFDIDYASEEVELLPEFWSKKPDKDMTVIDSWFERDGTERQKRIDVLTQCIEETR